MEVSSLKIRWVVSLTRNEVQETEQQCEEGISEFGFGHIERQIWILENRKIKLRKEFGHKLET